MKKICGVEKGPRFIVNNQAVMYHRISDHEIMIYDCGEMIPGVLAEDESGQQVIFPSNTKIRLV